MLYIKLTMKPIQSEDAALIGRYVEHAARKGWNVEMTGKKAGRSKGWASRLINGGIGSLKFTTRNRIRIILGELK